MDAMDVLGALLGSKRTSGSPGGSMLEEMLTRGRSGAASPSSRSTPSSPAATPRRQPAPSRHQPRRPKSIGEAARGLEELLGVTNDRYQQRHPQSRSQPAPAPTPTPAPQRESSSRYQAPNPHEEEALNAQSEILIRAMISAAKADGQIDDQEQQRITGKLGHLSQADIAFLRQELARPLDVRELAWDVPLGMEEQAYVMSLIGMDLDQNKEAEYLADLAHGLRLAPQRCNEIHRQYGAPEIFRT